MPFESAETVVHGLPLHIALGYDTAEHTVILPEAGNLQVFAATPAETIQFFFLKSHLVSSNPVISVGWSFLSLDEVFHMN